MTEFVRVAGAGDLEPGQCAVVSARGRAIALYNVDGTYYATDNICGHHGGPLGQGVLEGKIICCPWHAWTYDVTTGVCPVAENIRIQTFPVRISGPDVEVGF
jgi:nitrite reductase/ring-hydroxylating ferredoxin subunit